MTNILKRLQSATGPDREIDALIYCAEHGAKFVAFHNGWLTYEANRVFEKPVTTESFPRYTSSIDAALALVERMMPGCGYMITRGRCSIDEPMFGVQIYRSDLIQDDAGPEPYGFPSEHNSLGLAILTALFSALATKERVDAGFH